MVNEQIVITDVGPRDGLQNQPIILDVGQRLQLIDAIADAGVSSIEVGSFVNPKWVPQMSGSEEVFTQLEKHKGVTYAALTPNLQGFERAVAVGAAEVAVFSAASESFSQKNKHPQECSSHPKTQHIRRPQCYRHFAQTYQ